MNDASVVKWNEEDVRIWLEEENFSYGVAKLLCDENGVNGKCLLALNESDFALEPLSRLPLKDRKLLFVAVRNLQRENQSALVDLGLLEGAAVNLYSHGHYSKQEVSEYCESERSPPASEDGRSHKLQPEIFKAFLSLCYVVAVTWITAFVMVIVHDRVPDMKKYPPLPDIFLDNVPHIPWAFDMCEITGTFLFTIWLIVLLFHKHR